MAEPPQPTHPIESVERALRLLSLVGEVESITVSGAAADLGVARSTAHRLLATLRYRGFVSQDPLTKTYHAGPELLKIGVAMTGGMSQHQIVRPHLESLSKELDETVHLVLRHGQQVLFVDSVESGAAVRVMSRAGATMPAYATAAGQVLLAKLSSAEIHALFGDGELETLTPYSVSSVAELETKLEQVRRDGFATNFNGSENGVSAVAVAIPSTAGMHEMAVGVAVLSDGLDLSRAAEIAGVVRRYVDVIGETMASAAVA
ncbi:MAG TPA: IclR family transcriptional regulator [Solirubrobacteraceae bacterium]|nr:IclR family transcriptional regulator [Solirubrobacteraceae bacterium]